MQIFHSPLIPGEISTTAYSCEKEFTLYLQVKIFLLRLLYTKKEAFSKLQNKKGENKVKVLAEIRTSILI